MDRTESAIRKLLRALPAQGYDLGILTGAGMQRFESIPSRRLLCMLPYLKHRNAHEAHIFLRPTGESAYTLLDDLSSDAESSMCNEGFTPAAVIETSPGNFQAWLRHAQPLGKELGTLAAKMLAARFSADPSAADWRRFGRAPGFTNRKLKYRERNGLFPFARLTRSSGQVFAAAEDFSAELVERGREEQRQRTLLRRQESVPLRRSPTATLSLPRFRSAPRYVGRSAAADMAFSICACVHGWHADDIAAALRCDYLSENPDPGRRDAYIRRTLEKAQRWAA